METVGEMQIETEHCPLGVRVALGLGIPRQQISEMCSAVITKDTFHMVR